MLCQYDKKRIKWKTFIFPGKCDEFSLSFNQKYIVGAYSKEYGMKYSNFAIYDLTMDQIVFDFKSEHCPNIKFDGEFCSSEKAYWLKNEYLCIKHNETYDHTDRNRKYQFSLLNISNPNILYSLDTNNIDDGMVFAKNENSFVLIGKRKILTYDIVETNNSNVKTKHKGNNDNTNNNNEKNKTSDNINSGILSETAVASIITIKPVSSVAILNNDQNDKSTEFCHFNQSCKMVYDASNEFIILPIIQHTGKNSKIQEIKVKVHLFNLESNKLIANENNFILIDQGIYASLESLKFYFIKSINQSWNFTDKSWFFIRYNEPHTAQHCKLYQCQVSVNVKQSINGSINSSNSNSTQSAKKIDGNDDAYVCATVDCTLLPLVPKTKLRQNSDCNEIPQTNDICITYNQASRSHVLIEKYSKTETYSYGNYTSAWDKDDWAVKRWHQCTKWSQTPQTTPNPSKKVKITGDNNSTNKNQSENSQKHDNYYCQYRYGTPNAIIIDALTGLSFVENADKNGNYGFDIRNVLSNKGDKVGFIFMPDIEWEEVPDYQKDTKFDVEYAWNNITMQFARGFMIMCVNNSKFGHIARF